MSERNLSPEEVAAQTAKDYRDEWDVETAAVGSMVMVDDPDGRVIKTNLLGYADTAAGSNDMDFTYRELSGHNECGHTGKAYKITYVDNDGESQ